MAVNEGLGGLSKSNISSLDNPLAFGMSSYSQQAMPHTAYAGNYSQPQGNYNDYMTSSAPAANNNVTPRQMPNGGGIVQSNYSSSDNPLAFGYQNANYYQGSNNYDAANNWQQPQPSPRMGQQQYQQPSPGRNQQQVGFADPIDVINTYDPNKWSNVNNNNNSYEQANEYAQSSDTNYQYSSNAPKNDNQIRHDVGVSNKQAYRRALDQQVAEKEIAKFKLEKDRKKSEIDIIKQYPFGRRTDPSSYVFEDSKNSYNPQQASYKPSFGAGKNEDLQPRLNKDNIVEKPNSLSADIPPYDPIKHRTGFHQGYNYDPWGKPGSGAPLIDQNTGRKFTKYSGQLWYDHLGFSPDERARMYNDRNRPLTLEEQKHEMLAEQERRRAEDAIYKSKAGDVATWITEIDADRRKRLTMQGGAHLLHTNVTRDKVNKEYARRHVDHSSKNYHDDLGVQLEERYRTDKLHKLKDDVAGIEHTKKWDDWWGKPGGGAPNIDRRRRDLQGSLEPGKDLRGLNNEAATTSLQVGTGYSYSYGANSYNNNNNDFNNDKILLTKSTNKSSHRNLYDNMQPMKL